MFGYNYQQYYRHGSDHDIRVAQAMEQCDRLEWKMRDGIISRREFEIEKERLLQEAYNPSYVYR